MTPHTANRHWVLPSAITLIVALVLAALSPLFPRLGAPSGDAELGKQVLSAIGSHNRHHVAIAKLEPGSDTPRFAGFGATEHTEFEIGSITKTFTAILLAQAIEREELTANTTLGELFGDRAGKGTNITMLQLTTHTSGLPRLEPSNPLTSLTAAFLRTDPYTATAEELLAGLQTIDTPEPVSPDAGASEYSNYGVALLGLALAEAANTDYATLLQDRIFEPVGMNDTYLPVTPDGLAASAPRGYAAGGIPASPWTMHASAPAGGIRSTAADMARYLQAVMTGQLPGSELSTTQHALFDEHTAIGFGWLMDTPDAGTLTFHNGGTGGFSSIAGFSNTDTGLIVLSDTTESVDAALQVLDSSTASES